ncbi:MAG: hypothetical protein ACO3ZK_14640 [Rubrivivax sp.]
MTSGAPSTRSRGHAAGLSVRVQAGFDGVELHAANGQALTGQPAFEC